MTLSSRRAGSGFLGLFAVLGLALVAPGQEASTKAEQKKAAADLAKAPTRDLDGKFAPRGLLTAEGVILDLDVVGEVKKGESRPRRIRLNTNVVWRDWVRDQASVDDARRSNTAEAAKKGKQSIGTLGEPVGTNSLIVLEVPTDAKVETRFRSSTDAATGGSKTPDNAGTVEKALDASHRKIQKKAEKATEPRKEPAKNAPGAQISDLKSGLFVEIEYRMIEDKKTASRIRILRPIGGAQTPADQAKPK